MNRLKNRRILATSFAFMICCLLATGCDDPATGGESPAKDQQAADAPPSNRIDVPPAVRNNLGIEFTTVQRRHIAQTLRLPAQVELLPSATQYYRAPLAGRVKVHVEPLQKVVVGDVLYTLDSHQWRDLQRQLGTATNELTITTARLEAMQPLVVACEEHEASLRRALRVTDTYVDSLNRAQSNVGGQGEKLANARVEQARLAAQIAEASEKHTETETRTKELTAMRAAQQDQIDLLLEGAAAVLGVKASALANRDADGKPGWRVTTKADVRAKQAGVVQQIAVANGNLVEALGEVLTTLDPTRVRCHARALQSDLSSLRDGLPVSIVPASKAKATERVAATMQVSPTGNANTRTFDIYAVPSDEDLQFVRPGMAVFLEIVTATTERRELAIPKSCVLPDGLDRVFFRRDPRDPNKVIRIVADLGSDNGLWVAVLSGIKDGDEVVAAGAFELVLASSNQTPKGGHFHADGSWHADDEDHE